MGNKFGHKSRALLKYILLFCAGATSSLIFPPFKQSLLGYTALISFFVFLFKKDRSLKEMFWAAYVFGFAFFVVGFSWINNALLTDGEQFVAFVPLVMLAIGLFFGLFWGLPALATAKGKNVYEKMLIFTGCYVLLEWVRSFIFTGFPWNLLGTAFSFHPRMIQGASVIGTYGLSLLLLVLCCGVALIGISIWQKKLYKGSFLFILLPILCLFSFSFLYQPIGELDGLKIRLVQPNIPQTFKWQPALMYQNFRQYIDMSRVQPLDDVDMVVWGETATPYFLDRDEERLAEIQAAIPKKGFLVTGVLRIGYENGRQVPYNSLFVIDGNGDIKDYYDKSHLVPFGEFLPFRDYLPDFMEPVASVVGDLGRGEQNKNITVKGLPLMGGAICYESIFPHEVLNQNKKPEILLVLANDGWYGISAGPYQHLVAAQMRAVEEGVTVIRSANTGISAVILTNGEILGDIGLDVSGVTDVVLPKKLSRKTIYGTYGNIIPLGILLLLFIFIGVIRSYKSKISR